jgi:hypothetical protein
MRARYLVPLVLLLAACGTQRASCPFDTTSDIDATITQVTNPVVFAANSHHVPVEFAITIANRTDQPVKVGEITLEMPHFVGGGSLATLQCLGLDRLDNEIVSMSRGFDVSIPARSSAVFDIRSFMLRVDRDPQLFRDAQNALTLYIRTESGGRSRSERLTRKVIPGVQGAGDRS